MEKNKVKGTCYCCRKEKECTVIDGRQVCNKCNHLTKNSN